MTNDETSKGTARDEAASGVSKRDRAVDAVEALQRASVARGTDAITEDEILAEIAATRAARRR
ncbi:MAG: hypothetical protein ACYC2X_07600 [Coriobacteriia bacterium]